MFPNYDYDGRIPGSSYDKFESMNADGTGNITDDAINAMWEQSLEDAIRPNDSVLWVIKIYFVLL